VSYIMISFIKSMTMHMSIFPSNLFIVKVTEYFTVIYRMCSTCQQKWPYNALGLVVSYKARTNKRESNCDMKAQSKVQWKSLGHVKPRVWLYHSWHPMSDWWQVIRICRCCHHLKESWAILRKNMFLEI